MLILNKNCTVYQVMSNFIYHGVDKIVITDNENHLFGLVTRGDLISFIDKNIAPEVCIEKVCNRSPLAVRVNEQDYTRKAFDIMKNKRNINSIILLDEDNTPIDFITLPVVNKSDEALLLLQAKQILDFRQTFPPKTLREAEFKIFSQSGEDGIIQWIISVIKNIIPIFIEFGVEDYRESNTRFLLMNNNWKGLVIDSDSTKVEAIKQSEYYWKYDLNAECAFVDIENINSLFEKNGFSGDIGILSIDVDGNDYWIWEAINAVSPQVVICEYNSLWGNEKSLAVEYNPSFFRTEAHYSNLYWGASIKALNNLAESKGYCLLGSNSMGNNLFFVKSTYASLFTTPLPQEAYVESKFRESRGINGELTYKSGKERLSLVRELPLKDIETGKISLISDIFQCCKQ